MTIKEWLEGVSNTNQSSDEDSSSMQKLLHIWGFPKARVVVGIVYLEGKGTLDAPPASIHSIAKMILKNI